MKTYRVLFLGLILLAVAASAANVAGKWMFVFTTQVGERQIPFVINAKGAEVTGTAEQNFPIEGKFEAGVLDLRFPYFSEDAGTKAELRIRGTLEGEKITGKWRFAEYTGTFTATRQ